MSIDWCEWATISSLLHKFLLDSHRTFSSLLLKDLGEGLCRPPLCFWDVSGATDGMGLVVLLVRGEYPFHFVG